MRLQTVGFVVSLALVLLAVPLAAAVQHPAKIYRIGDVGPGSGSTLPVALGAVRQQLRHLGYIEGQNLGIEYR